jgi:3-methyladenine DNA glycosylase AlkD
MTETPKLTIPPGLNLDQLVERYVKLRDNIKAKEDEQKQALAPFKELMKEMELAMQQHLASVGAESVATAHGTVYTTTKKSATVADAQVFRDWIIEHQAWDVCDIRANAPAVADYLDHFGALPPGLNYSTTMAVNIRRK